VRYVSGTHDDENKSQGLATTDKRNGRSRHVCVTTQAQRHHAWSHIHLAAVPRTRSAQERGRRQIRCHLVPPGLALPQPHRVERCRGKVDRPVRQTQGSVQVPVEEGLRACQYGTYLSLLTLTKSTRLRQFPSETSAPTKAEKTPSDRHC
jgi:hypothetical protein